MNKADAVHDLIARAPSLIRQARAGDQNALAVIDQVGRFAREGRGEFIMIHRAFESYINGEAPMFGAERGGRTAKRVHLTPAKRPAPRRPAPKHPIVKHKPGTSVLAPHGATKTSTALVLGRRNQNQNPLNQNQNQGQYGGYGGGGGSGGGDSGGLGDSGDAGDGSSATDSDSFSSTSDMGDSDNQGMSPIDETADSAVSGDPRALSVVEHIFRDAHSGDPNAQALARSIQEYVRRKRLSGTGAVATVVGLANGAPLSRDRIGAIAAQFSGEDKTAFYHGVKQPHAKLPPLPDETAKCVLLGQCVGIAKNLQLARMRRHSLSKLHPVIGWEAGEEIWQITGL